MMPRTPLYSFNECIDLMNDCRLEELVALSVLLIEEWQSYTIEQQVLLLPALAKRRKELYRTTDRKYIYFRGRGDDISEKFDPE